MNGHVLARDGSLVPIPNAGDHQLAQLAAAVGITLAAQENDVLERLSAFVLFAGRYPIPKRWEESVAREVASGEKVAPVFFRKEDLSTAELLSNRFKTELLRTLYGT